MVQSFMNYTNHNQLNAHTRSHGHREEVQEGHSPLCYLSGVLFLCATVVVKNIPFQQAHFETPLPQSDTYASSISQLDARHGFTASLLPCKRCMWSRKRIITYAFQARLLSVCNWKWSNYKEKHIYCLIKFIFRNTCDSNKKHQL